MIRPSGIAAVLYAVRTGQLRIHFAMWGRRPIRTFRNMSRLSSRLSWQSSIKPEISLAEFNLLHAHHQEWTIPPSEHPCMVMMEADNGIQAPSVALKLAGV